jgi:hypothetical protein
VQFFFSNLAIYTVTAQVNSQFQQERDTEEK